MIAVFDSNVWIAELGLRSTLGAVARFYLKHTKARLALPEVVRLEVEHNLRNRLKEQITRIEDDHRQLLTVFGTLKALVVPDPSAIEAKVNELFGSLGIDVLDVPFSLASARSSFLQTINKLPPSDKTQEFKDGVIWADCLKLLEQDDVCLVTADKAFFQSREYGNGLSRTLAAEIASAKNRGARGKLPPIARAVRHLAARPSYPPFLTFQEARPIHRHDQRSDAYRFQGAAASSQRSRPPGIATRSGHYRPSCRPSIVTDPSPSFQALYSTP